MPHHEYKVVPAPERARKTRGLKGAALFAHEMEVLMNELAADGWVYVRADTLPHEERSGLTSKITTYRNLLIFQREIKAEPIAATAIASPKAKSAPPPAPQPAPKSMPAKGDDEDEDLVNLWDAPTVTPAPDAPLFPDRQRKRMDL